MANNFEIHGVEEIIERFDKISSAKNMHKAMTNAVLRVEGSAIQNAQAIKDTGALSQSIKSRIETNGNDILGIVYSTLEYAPYVEYGTGKYAEEGGSSGYWVYVIDDTPNKTKKKKDEKEVKHYTLEEAKKVMAYLRSKGLKAYYTEGQKARPYLRPAVTANREAILNDLKEGMND